MGARAKRIKRMLLVSFVNHFLCGTHFFSLKNRLVNVAGVKLGKGTNIVGPFHIGNNLDLEIGEDCWIGKEFSIHGDGKVLIGDRCDFGPEVSILTGSHKIGDEVRRAGEGVSYSLSIGNGCWIGARATLMGDIRVGDSAVIAACALVNQTINGNELVGGIPAKVLKELSEGEENNG